MYANQHSHTYAVEAGQALEFLNLLESGDEVHTFQTFDDREERKKHPDLNLTKIAHGTLADHLDLLSDLNWRGAGVYVTVNRTDGTGRKKQNITRIRAIFGEFDEGIPPELPLEPSVIVRTSAAKYHYYWFVDGLSIDEFEGVMRRMVRDYKSDKRAADVTRVLRVPGFYHQKGEPHLVDLLSKAGRRYTREEIVTAFPPVHRENGGAGQGANDNCDPVVLTQALNFIPAHDRDVWLKVGMALHHAYCGSDAGFELWDDWSKNCSDKYSNEATVKAWRSFGIHNEPITLATLFKLASSHGWKGKNAKDRASTDAIVWPETDSKGRAIGKSQPNIRFFLDHVGASLHYDAFSLVCIVLYAGQPTSELDDRMLLVLHMQADELALFVRHVEPHRYAA